MPSYYEVLGVAPDADQARIRDAYADAVRSSSPTGDGPQDRKLDEAYVVVGDPDRRRRYDALRMSEGSGGNAELMALLSVIADRGSIPTSAELLGPPPEPDPPPEPEPPPAPAPVPPDHVPLDAAPRPTEPRTGRAATDAPGTVELPTAEPSTAEPVPGTDGGRSQLARRRTIAGIALAGTLVGIAAGLLYARAVAPDVALEPGGCVALGPTDAAAVACDDPAADARIAEVVEDPATCPVSPLGTLELPAGAGCLVELDDAGTGS